jgi:hypothetical protein
VVVVFAFDASLSWQIGMLWLAAGIVGAFLISFSTDAAHVRRTPYVGLLAIGTAALSWFYVDWTGAGRAFWTWHWFYGIAGGLVAAALLVARAQKIPSDGPAPRGGELTRLFAWEDAVYGAAEGILLSVLPVAVVWQIGRSLGWTGGFVRGGGWAIVSVLASLVLIAIHHLGYPEFRGPLMRYPVTLCGVLSIAFVVTGSPLAAVIGHIAFHAAVTVRGTELPPRSHRFAASVS